jgi:hypothetical protein
MALTYATWDPAKKGSSMTLSNGNLTSTITGSTWQSALATIGKSSGKWYWEIKFEGTQGGTDLIGGVGLSTITLASYLGSDANGYSYYNGSPGIKINNGTQTNVNTTFTVNDVIGYKLDMDGGSLAVQKNGIDVATLFTGLSGTFYPAYSQINTGNQLTVNFGATAFAYTVPSGFNAGVYTGSASFATKKLLLGVGK